MSTVTMKFRKSPPWLLVGGIFLLLLVLVFAAKTFLAADSTPAFEKEVEVAIEAGEEALAGKDRDAVDTAINDLITVAVKAQSRQQAGRSVPDVLLNEAADLVMKLLKKRGP